MKTYQDFKFNEKTKEFIRLNGFVEPTPIQNAVIPMAIKGKDIVAISDTGTGKTHAFLIPLMERVDTSQQIVQAVITAPTRELAMQIFKNAKVMMEADPTLRVKLITGGIERSKMADSIKQQPHIVIGTPGRIKDLFLEQSVLRVDTASIYVVDEADMTLEYGFLDDVDAICGRMKDHLQMMAFSATIPNALKPFLKKYMSAPQTIHMKDAHASNPKIEHVLIPCKHKSYGETLLDIMPGFMPYVCLIFANTRDDAGEVAALLRKNGKTIVEIHGGLQARQRKQAMKQLESSERSYVVATDIAARGLDVEGITHVVSLGFPSELDFYIHRSGRTGRAGKEGTCFALYKESDEKAIRTLREKGIHFEHRNFKNGSWQELKPFGQKMITKNDVREKEIAKTLTRKNEKVKPGYKKKKAEMVKKIKQKERRDHIRNEIKEQRKERYKTAQRLKSKGIIE
ncbi:DEAD/DEAH box helicase [Anaerorhabdus furcosa]|uniref:ATP-dependent RNA helicase CshB n=1 Tax=Anaerorhabdus furcosa TaxID=118967 RepID=A0A1T4P6S9_9FIRM|nr:DEAD/DEAH box helicase [Anaerorhabdus furcosa]SJZ87285.1 ATP-dependent RNA helicase CshB [Anaerorhabdus furcosa]